MFWTIFRHSTPLECERGALGHL